MHKLLVLYPEPADRDHFRDYYVTNHLPLVARMPGLLAWRYSFDVATTPGQTPYFAVFEADFADAAAMTAARDVAAGPRRWPPMWPTTPPVVRSSSTIRCRTAPAEPSIRRLERIGQMRREFM